MNMEIQYLTISVAQVTFQGNSRLSTMSKSHLTHLLFPSQLYITELLLALLCSHLSTKHKTFRLMDYENDSTSTFELVT